MTAVAARLLAAAFLLSILVPLCEALLPALPLARGSLAALAILPWLVLAPLPRRRCDASRPAWREPLFGACLALPPLCLGVGLDLARGAEPRALAALSAAAWLVLFLWSWASECAARAARTRSIFAALWFLLLPGASALCCALAWVPLRASTGTHGRARLFALDPLVWCHRWGRAGGLAQPALVELVLAVFGALLVVGVVLVLGRHASAEERP